MTCLHIIIIGAGDVGYHLAKALYQDHEVVIIDKDEDALGQVMGLDVQIIQGNGADIRS